MLLLAVLPLRTASSQVLLAIVVCASGLLLVREAVRAEKYSWAGGIRSDCCAFQSDRTRCALWKQRPMAEWVCVIFVGD